MKGQKWKNDKREVEKKFERKNLENNLKGRDEEVKCTIQ